MKQRGYHMVGMVNETDRAKHIEQNLTQALAILQEHGIADVDAYVIGVKFKDGHRLLNVAGATLECQNLHMELLLKMIETLEGAEENAD